MFYADQSNYGYAEPCLELFRMKNIKIKIVTFFNTVAVSRIDILDKEYQSVVNDLSNRNMEHSSPAEDALKELYTDELKIRSRESWDLIKEFFDKNNYKFTENELTQVSQILQDAIEREEKQVFRHFEEKSRTHQFLSKHSKSVQYALGKTTNQTISMVQSELTLYEKVKDIIQTPKETLEPKPPELLQNIKWLYLYGHKNKLIILIVIVILPIYFLAKYCISGSPNENIMSLSKPKLVTISSNEITLPGPGTYLVDTENKADSDDLKKIYGLSEGDEVTLKAADDNRTIDIRKGHYLIMPANFSLNNEDDFVVFKSKGSNIFAEVHRQNNGD